MNWGKRRVVAAAVAGVMLGGTLAGCSSAQSLLGLTNGEAVAIGQQALGFTASGGSSADWTSPVSCPASFEQGMRTTGPAGATYEKLDPTTISGFDSDPKLTSGYVATCAYRITSGTQIVTELAFFDIDDVHAAAIPTKLMADGFASQGTISNTLNGQPYSQTIYSNGVSRIVVETLTADSIPALIVVG